MTTSSGIQKDKSNESRKQVLISGAPQASRQFRKRDLLALPLIGFIVVCIYAVMMQFPGQGYLFTVPLDSLLLTILFSPFFNALFIGLFCSFYVYKIIRRAAAPLFVSIIAYMIAASLLASLFFAGVTTPSGTCEGFFGVPEDCANIFAFKFAFLLFNPYVGSILSLLSLAGTVGLALGGRKV